MRSVVIWPGLVLSLLVGLGMGELILSQDLPPEMRADQYLLEGTRALKQKDPAAALRAFEKLEALPVDPPPEFFYWYGQALVAHGISREDVAMVNQGEGFLKQYLLETGRESDHYASALEWLSRAEGQGLPQPQQPANDAAQEGTETDQKAEMKLDKCDDNLWGAWGYDELEPSNRTEISNSMGKDGIETVTVEIPPDFGIIGGFKRIYRVDRKFHAWPDGGEVWASCRGWNEYGYRVLHIMHRKAKGVFPARYETYFVDKGGILWHSGGKIYEDRDANGHRRREEEFQRAATRY